MARRQNSRPSLIAASFAALASLSATIVAAYAGCLPGMSGVAGSPTRSNRSAPITGAVFCFSSTSMPTAKAPVCAARPRVITAVIGCGMVLMFSVMVFVFFFLWFALPATRVCVAFGVGKVFAELPRIGNSAVAGGNVELFTILAQLLARQGTEEV